MRKRATPGDPATGEADFSLIEVEVAARVGELHDHDVDFAAMAAVSNVYRVASAVRNHMERNVLKPDSLSWSGFSVLFVLWVWGEQESRHLAQRCAVTKGTLTGIVSTLEARGLVARRPNPHDKRMVIVGLTASGRSMIKRLFPKFNEHEALVTTRLNDDDRRALAHLLREVLRHVEDISTPTP